jgi:hypothetical protein
MSIAPHSPFQNSRLQGPTPEFVRWSIDCACPIREPIETMLVEKTERYLWSLAAIGQCLSRGNIIDDVCIVNPDSDSDTARGCFVHEVAAFYGGLEFCQKQCGACAANVPARDDVPEKTKDETLAGCFGWLIRTEDLVQRLDEIIAGQLEELSSRGVFRPTHPAWYGLWSADRLEGKSLELVARIFDQLAKGATASIDVRRFREALVQCRNKVLSLSVQLVPAGHAVGTEWTIGPFCPDCRAPVGVGIRQCNGCGRRGHGHPAMRRKLIGQRPFVNLNSLVGAARAGELLSRLAEARAASTSRSHGIEANHP